MSNSSATTTARSGCRRGPPGRSWTRSLAARCASQPRWRHPSSLDPPLLLQGSNRLSRLPVFAVADHGVEGDDEFSHDGDDDDLWPFACGLESFFEGAEGRVGFTGDQGSHVGDVAQVSSPTEDMSLSAQQAAVAV